MTKPNYIPNHGGLATSRYDFQDHVDGYAFRHNAEDIDVNPAVSIQNNPYVTVSSALDAIANIIATQTSGQGFITIGDNLDTYHNAIATPNTPYDSSVPSINATINDLLTNTSNPDYPRIRDGGIIVIKSGTYIVDNTINIPAGITIMGEGFGTKIINATPTQKPLFNIKRDISRIPDAGIDPNIKFMYARETKFYNLTIADNFVLPKFLGDTSYKTPKNILTAAPLISVEAGAHFTADNVKFIGKTAYAGPTLSSVTSHAIKVDITTPITSGTIINVNNCFIDGFAVPVDFRSVGALNDFLFVTNNKIRGYGFLASDLVNPVNNSIILVNDCNLEVTSNHFDGITSNIDSAVYFASTIGTVGAYQFTSKMTVINNNATVNRNGAFNGNFQFMDFGTLSNFSSLIRLMVFGNNFDNKFTVRFDNATEVFIITPTDMLVFADATFNQNVTVNEDVSISGTFLTQGSVYYNASGAIHYGGFTYTIQSPPGDTEYLFLIDTSVQSSGTTTINLPDVNLNVGRQLIIKDIGGKAGLYNIVIVPDGTDKIEGLNSNKNIINNYGGCTLLAADPFLGWVLL